MTRVVLITNDSTYGQRVLHALSQRGVVLDAALVLTGSFGFPRPRGVGLVGRILRWPKWTAAAARRKVQFHRRRRAAYASCCARVIATDVMNGPGLLRHLRELAPEWIILGGGGILGREVIGTARAGVLNAHPALLPWIRGCGVTGASLDHGVALGATLHFVDVGIDTGPVVERRLLAVTADDTELAPLERACEELAAEMLVNVVEFLVRRGGVATGVAQTRRYPLFRWPGPDGRLRHRAAASAGRPHALYLEWRLLCTGTDSDVLPARLIDAPTTLTLESLESLRPP
ncbi:MAG: formyltransferase family protein [Gemmatimonadaceae bacterium]